MQIPSVFKYFFGWFVVRYIFDFCQFYLLLPSSHTHLMVGEVVLASSSLVLPSFSLRSMITDRTLMAKRGEANHVAPRVADLERWLVWARVRSPEELKKTIFEFITDYRHLAA